MFIINKTVSYAYQIPYWEHLWWLKLQLVREAAKNVLTCNVKMSKPKTIYTVCPGSSDPPEKILNIFASENEVYTIF